MPTWAQTNTNRPTTLGPNVNVLPNPTVEEDIAERQELRVQAEAQCEALGMPVPRTVAPPEPVFPDLDNVFVEVNTEEEYHAHMERFKNHQRQDGVDPPPVRIRI